MEVQEDDMEVQEEAVIGWSSLYWAVNSIQSYSFIFSLFLFHTKVQYGI